MCNYNSDEQSERYAMGRLHGAELGAFEDHLRRCQKCREAVLAVDFFVRTLKGALGQPQQDTSPAFLMRRTFRGESLLVQARLSKCDSQNIGILLLDTHSDRLYSRFRRDWEEFAGSRAHWLKQLPDAVLKESLELGGEGCLQWLSAFTRTIRISKLSRVVASDDPSTILENLYVTHIRPNILPFHTHLPQYSLEAAAGKFGKQMAVEPEGWVEVLTQIPLADDMFVTHVTGHSMEPQIPDVSLCAFRSKIVGSVEGKVLLIEKYGEPGGSRYTVKRCHIASPGDPEERIGTPWLHPRITLESTNLDYKPIEVAPDQKIVLLGEFLFVV